MIVIENIKKDYDGKNILDIPRLCLEEGKLYAVIGSNGCGKSTLAKLLAGVLRADSKEFGISFGMADGWTQGTIGYLPQKPFAFNMSLERNIGLMRGDNCQQLMEQLKLDALKKKNAKLLSGGEAQKMALARILSKSFSVLILDEPTSAMDIESTLVSEQLIKEYQKNNGSTVVLITHQLNQAKRTADNVIFLHQGQLLEQGPAVQVLEKPESSVIKSFIEFYRA